jgi:nitrogen fixation/metabolism regulation signal transduction histidine kinase
MMSIRVRLVIMCLAVSLLPAIPLSFLVQSLLEKSFNVGLNDSVEDALKSGSDISRRYFEQMRSAFEKRVYETVSEVSPRIAADGSGIDSAGVAAVFNRGACNGDVSSQAGGVAFICHPATAPPEEREGIPFSLSAVAGDPAYGRLVGGKAVTERPAAKADGGEVLFFETNDRSLLLASWDTARRHQWRSADGDVPVAILFYEKTDPEFLAAAGRLIEGRQIFAQLRLEQERLSRSFFYPFIIIYGVILLVSLVLALVMAERLAAPIRRLVQGTQVVAGGDWSYRLRSGTRGEIGRLVDAFNTMVARLEAQRKRLIDMEKMAAWREIARRLAHEIKNPLLPIRLTIEELRDQYRGEDKKYEELLSESTRVVGDELSSLQKLVKEFSSFAKMPELSPRPGSLELLVRDVAKLYPRVPVRIDSNPALEDFAFDPDQMRRVFVNLFDNSIAAIGEDEDGRIRIRLDRTNGDVRIEFTDNGPGIPVDRLPRIFEPYFTSKSEGTGLGLAMVKNIILLHGGSIDAKSDQGQGTTFTITIPMRRDET